MTENRCKLVYTPFGDVDQFSVRAVECYERALEEAEQRGTKVRALLLTNPHNPLGKLKDERDRRNETVTVDRSMLPSRNVRSPCALLRQA